ncbi:sugar ABC transporter ATP-binding protein [Parafrigoribacterium mesophilum]|uniref:sugar ABC transporter ATP-binding protein n=1 Tax=Parafrigoribacterium mesophilum TaxID=433646 RepID=UPI0031FC29CE
MSIDTAVDGDIAPFVLHARNIHKSFNGVEVLHGVDLDIVGGRTLALLGENGAGKSTLVRVIAGDHRPDAGTLEVNGETNRGFDPITAKAAGVRMVFQEFTDAPMLSVAENISLGRWPARHGVVSWPKLRRRAVEILDDLEVDLDPDALVGTLRVGERQICEIARALADNGKCLILDEPTAALSSSESEQLFGNIRRLQAKGVAIIYITHRLDEVAKIADDLVVLRNGEVTLSGAVAGTSRREIVTAMVGRQLDDVRRPDNAGELVESGPALALRNASSSPAFDGVHLDVRPGEVVALYGKIGSGIAELADAVFGMRAMDGGELAIADSPARFAHPRAAIEAGIAYLPGDRQRQGAFMNRPVTENLAAASWSRLATGGVLTERRERGVFQRWQDRLRIALSDAGQPIATLSGGNQQKVLLARWLERGSKVLVLVEPTRGVDVGSRQDIYRVIREQAAAGAAVLIVTSDHEEVVQVADRAVVMVSGRVTNELAPSDITTERLIDEAAG